METFPVVGVIGLAKSLSIELGPDNIRVNAILPGLVSADRQRRVFEAEARQRGISYAEIERTAFSYTSIKDYVTPEQIADRSCSCAARAAGRFRGRRSRSAAIRRSSDDIQMIPWRQIGKTEVPGAEVELRLMRRGDDFSMMLGPNELMSSRLSGSEEALATLACKRIEAVKRPHLLIGGLGMGFTLRAALTVLGADARVMVAELVPAVIAWARGPMAEIFGDSLTDSRAEICCADVVEVIRSHVAAFDAILLDVDNGPEGLIRKDNDALYDLKGLKAIRRALRPGGVLAVWSSGPHPRFSQRLRDAGFDVNEVAVRATTKRSGARHLIWFAAKPKAGR